MLEKQIYEKSRLLKNDSGYQSSSEQNGFNGISSDIEHQPSTSRNQTEVEDESDWINCKKNHYREGITQKKKDINDNWEYKTTITNNLEIVKLTICQNILEINNQEHLAETILFSNRKIILGLLNFNNIKELKYRIYENKNQYNQDLLNLSLDYIEENFISVEQSKTIQSSWSSIFLHDSKKMLQGLVYLTAVVGIKTIQRAFTVIVSGEGEMDWNKMLKTINPMENPIEFGLTLPQLLISVLAMDVWKWGLTNIISEIKKLTEILEITTTDSGYSEIINNQADSTNSKSIFKFFVAKLGYWIPNHLMITLSSMFSVKSLTSVTAYLNKLKSKWNILSSAIRAEVLWFLSEFLKDALSKFGETHLITNIKPHIINLFEKIKNLQSNNSNYEEHSKTYEIIKSSLKIIAFLSIMTSATVIDNANKTAVVMWTADKLDEFVPSFFTWEMAGIMIGLISIDTFGNKYCNVIAKKEFSKLWNALKSSCKNNTEQSNINGGDIEVSIEYITSDNETETETEQYYDGLDEPKNQDLNVLFKKYNLNKEEFHDSLSSQSWLNIEVNEINASEPSTSNGIYHSNLENDRLST